MCNNKNIEFKIKNINFFSFNIRKKVFIKYNNIIFQIICFIKL